MDGEVGVCGERYVDPDGLISEIGPKGEEGIC